MAGKDYGGKCTMRLSTGERIALRAGVKHMPSGIEASAIVNQDGSNDRQVTLKDRRAEITFADRGLDYEQLMKSRRFNVTFVEEYTGVTHIYNQAFVIGEPTVDRATGEVSGLTISCEQYIRKAAA
jgi:hypothetical protein